MHSQTFYDSFIANSGNQSEYSVDDVILSKLFFTLIPR